MNQDLKIIKKYFGEKMMHLCRSIFATILDNSPGILPQILLDNFAPSHFLYDDITANDNNYTNHLVDFKNYIYSHYDSIRENEKRTTPNIPHPKVLMQQVGYTLYECNTEQEVQSFKKYYSPGEALCTFNGGRLSRCHIFFAVKDNADKLLRNNFHIPERQDEYGTSVISIQFTRDASHTLSIKNRYNHTVPNPDATFSNNLENIIPGLTDSFKEHYNLNQKHQEIISFELPNYIRANDGKLYRYNFEYNNIYYCPNNIIISNFQPTKFDKERYLILDCFIIDLVNKKITSNVNCSSSYNIPPIKKITINKDKDNKIITINFFEGEDIIITINKYSQVISYQDNNLTEVPSFFLSYAKYLEQITMNNATSIGDDFLKYNQSIHEINFPKVITIGDNFLEKNFKSLEKITLPKVKTIGHNFCCSNNSLKTITLTNVIEIKDDFFSNNSHLHEINLPKVKKIGHCFCYLNKVLTKLVLPRVKSIDSGFLQQNKSIRELYLPKLESLDYFINSNKEIDIFYAPLITVKTDKNQKIIHQKKLVRI